MFAPQPSAELRRLWSHSGTHRQSVACGGVRRCSQTRSALHHVRVPQTLPRNGDEVPRLIISRDRESGEAADGDAVVSVAAVVKAEFVRFS
jgi:hypothetical protein